MYLGMIDEGWMGVSAVAVSNCPGCGILTEEPVSKPNNPCAVCENVAAVAFDSMDVATMNVVRYPDPVFGNITAAAHYCLASQERYAADSHSLTA